MPRQDHPRICCPCVPTLNIKHETKSSLMSHLHTISGKNNLRTQRTPLELVFERQPSTMLYTMPAALKNNMQRRPASLLASVRQTSSWGTLDATTFHTVMPNTLQIVCGFGPRSDDAALVRSFCDDIPDRTVFLKSCSLGIFL